MKFESIYTVLQDKDFPYYLKNSTLTYAVKLEIASNGMGLNVFYIEITKNAKPIPNGKNEFGYSLLDTEWAAALCSNKLLLPADANYWNHMVHQHLEYALKTEAQKV